MHCTALGEYLGALRNLISVEHEAIARSSCDAPLACLTVLRVTVLLPFLLHFSIQVRSQSDLLNAFYDWNLWSFWRH